METHGGAVGFSTASSLLSFGTVTTDSTGQFIFVNLPAGVYTLTETDPAGYVSTGVQPGVGGTSLTLNSISISVTGTNNSVASTTGQAVNVNATTIGDGLAFVTYEVVRDA